MYSIIQHKHWLMLNLLFENYRRKQDPFTLLKQLLPTYNTYLQEYKFWEIQ